MKKLFLLLAAAVMMSCQEDKPNGMSGDTVMYVNSSATPKALTRTGETTETPDPDEVLPTPLEVVERADGMDWHNSGVRIGDWNKDVANIRFMFLNVINEAGGLEPALIEARDLVFYDDVTGLTADLDTIAYIPNAVMEAGENAIKSAYNAGEYAECEQLFKELFNFIPTTGKQWREMKAQGIN